MARMGGRAGTWSTHRTVRSTAVAEMLAAARETQAAQGSGQSHVVLVVGGSAPARASPSAAAAGTPHRPRRRGRRRRRRPRRRPAARRSAPRPGGPPAASDAVRESETATSTARPSAPPIMNEVFTTPEASPDSCGSTSPIAASSTGLKAMPAPMPSRIIEGSTSMTKLPSTGARREQRQADARPAPGRPSAAAGCRTASPAGRRPAASRTSSPRWSGRTRGRPRGRCSPSTCWR